LAIWKLFLVSVNDLLTIWGCVVIIISIELSCSSPSPQLRLQYWKLRCPKSYRLNTLTRSFALFLTAAIEVFIIIPITPDDKILIHPIVQISTLLFDIGLDLWPIVRDIGNCYGVPGNLLRPTGDRLLISMVPSGNRGAPGSAKGFFRALGKHKVNQETR